MMSYKKKIFAYSDSTLASTGFGVVSRYILRALWETGEYNIHQLGINHPAKFSSTEETPWQIVPAKLHDPKDPYGYTTFLHMLSTSDYDYLFIINDTYVVNKITGDIKNLLQQKKEAGKKIPIIVYYYPVDCHVPNHEHNLIEIADASFTYNDYSINETLKIFPHLKDKIGKVYHGTDTSVFKPLPKVQVQKYREDIFHITPEQCLITNIGKNSSRKQISTSILAFAEFKKRFNNSILYLHTNPIEPRMNIDLLVAVKDLGLVVNKDVLFPSNYNPLEGIPNEMLNIVYNSSDMFLSTHVGEGWGLPVTEAMSCGVPVVTGNNTSMSEILGQDRGYMYPCKERTFIDASGYRPEGRLEDIVAAMTQCKYDGDRYSNPKVIAAKKWVDKHTWNNIGQQWVEIFKKVSKKNIGSNSLSAEVL
jgi:glycosyltransferase involved in cell wall biosynthesis